MGNEWPLSAEVSRVNSANTFAIVLSLCFLVILLPIAEGRAGAQAFGSLGLLPVFVSAQLRQPCVQGCFVLRRFAFNFGGVEASSIDRSVDSRNAVKRCEAGPHQYFSHIQEDCLSLLKLEELQHLRLRFDHFKKNANGKTHIARPMPTSDTRRS